MASSNLVRRASPTFFIDNKDVTEELLKHIVDVEIIDNLEGTLDEIIIKLNNENNRFLTTNWAIPKGTQIKFGIKTLNWNSEFEGESQSDVGIFNIDIRQFNRKTATFKGISGPLNSRDVKRSKIWANISLEALGKEFADKYKLKYFYKVKDNITLKNLKQEEEEDFSLEVSSCGISAPLVLERQYTKNIGREIEVKTATASHTGVIKVVNNGQVTLEVTSRQPKPQGKGKITVTEQILLPIEEIKEAKLKLKF